MLAYEYVLIEYACSFKEKFYGAEMALTQFLSVYGTVRYDLLFYVICGQSEFVELPSDFSLEAKISTHQLCFYESNNKMVLIDVKVFSEEFIDTYLYKILNFLSNSTAKLVWCMFDGAFGSCTECFSEWQKQQIYAVFSPKLGIHYCATREEMLSQQWQRLLDRAAFIFQGSIVQLAQ